MTIAFDFSVEEIWVPLIAGATLVPKPGGSSLLGDELRDFLQDNKVTALCCVPTLLATLDEDLPELRFLLVSGEACPQDLITRWHRSDRRFLNVYGPTEATVTVTRTPIYDPYYWWHERLWKLETAVPLSGTPFKNLIWRLLGVRLGRRVFDDGYLPEETLVTIGDACTLNASSVIQCHSQEDGTFTSDHTTIGAGCTVGIDAFIHYGVTMGDNAVLDTDSLPHERRTDRATHPVARQSSPRDPERGAGASRRRSTGDSSTEPASPSADLPVFSLAR